MLRSTPPDPGETLTARAVGGDAAEVGVLDTRAGFKPLDLLFGPATSPSVQLFRYTLVGGTAFVVDFSALTALVSIAGLHYLAAAAIAFLGGLLTNYALSVMWVFPERRVKSPLAEFGIFAGIGVLGLGINELTMWLLTSLAGLDYRASKLAAAVVVYVWNFTARKRALFEG